MPKDVESEEPVRPYRMLRDCEAMALRVAAQGREYASMDPPDDELAAASRQLAGELAYEGYYVAVKHGFDPDAARLETFLAPYLSKLPGRRPTETND